MPHSAQGSQTQTSDEEATARSRASLPGSVLEEGCVLVAWAERRVACGVAPETIGTRHADCGGSDVMLSRADAVGEAVVYVLP